MGGSGRDRDNARLVRILAVLSGWLEKTIQRLKIIERGPKLIGRQHSL
jgi:hypothetical protein